MYRMYFATEEEALEYFGEHREINIDEEGCYVEVEEPRECRYEEEILERLYNVACYTGSNSRLYLAKSGKSGVTYNKAEAKIFKECEADSKVKYANQNGTYKWFKEPVK